MSDGLCSSVDRTNERMNERTNDRASTVTLAHAPRVNDKLSQILKSVTTPLIVELQFDRDLPYQ